MNLILIIRHSIDESPWPFLVSTASLFLTLGAVMFFDFFVASFDVFSYCLVLFFVLFNYVLIKHDYDKFKKRFFDLYKFSYDSN